MSESTIDELVDAIESEIEDLYREFFRDTVSEGDFQAAVDEFARRRVALDAPPREEPS
jgi:hypothetical protein